MTFILDMVSGKTIASGTDEATTLSAAPANGNGTELPQLALREITATTALPVQMNQIDLVRLFSPLDD